MESCRRALGICERSFPDKIGCPFEMMSFENGKSEQDLYPMKSALKFYTARNGDNAMTC